MAPRAKRPNKRNKRKTGHRKQVQKKFQLQKASAAQVKSISTMAECNKYSGAVGNEDDHTKLGISSFYVSNTASATFLPIHSFYYMKSYNDIQANYSLRGKDIFSKYLQMKLEVQYPVSKFGPTEGARPLEVVYGFCKPLNLTNTTTPTEENVTRTQILNHVLNQIAQDFDSSDDTMEFKDRRKRSYNIVGRFKIVPDQRKNIIGPMDSASDAGVTTLVGMGNNPPPLRRNVNWQMKRKIRFEKSVQGDTSDPAADPILYPSQAYLPWILLYNPDYANFKDNVPGGSGQDEQIHQIKVRHFDCHWFNDF